MKKDRAFTYRLLSLILCVFVIGHLSIGVVSAEESPRKTVRVGFFAFDGYHMIQENGEMSGYGYDLIKRMAGYTNWDLEFVGYDKSWSEMQDMLERGEIDLLTSAQKTADRIQRFDFSQDPIGTSSAILTVKAGDETYLSDDCANWSGMRVGMIEGNSRNDGFASFAAEHGFTYEAVYFDDAQAMVGALQAGDGIDAIVSSNLRAIENEWTIAVFDASPFYIIVQKGNDELLSEINNALDNLFHIEAGLRTDLMNKYYSPDSGDDIAFTAEERAFIRSMSDTPLVAILNPDRAPYSYWKDGQLTGIVYDIDRMIIERSGLNVVFADMEDSAQYMERVASGDYDIRFDAGSNVYDHDENHNLTLSYLEAPISRLYIKDQRSFESAALLENSVVAAALEEMLDEQGITAVFYKSTQEVVDAVLSGRQDVAYLNSSAATLAMQSDITNRLIAEEVYGYTSQYSIAVSNRFDPLLYSVLNKTAASIQSESIDEVSRGYSSYADQPFSILGFIYDYPVYVTVGGAVLVLIVALVALTLSLAHKRRREKARLVEEERRNQLLADALAAAENAGAAKSQFLSRMSHEMRTPLNAIIGFMDLAKDAGEDDMKVYLRNSDIAAKQLLAVINEVLDMSAIESGKLKISKTDFDLRQTIEGITNIYLPLCTQKGLEYETKIMTPVDEWLVGDPLRINQILMNLLGNSVKFTSEGHVWLKISQMESARNDVFIRFEVCDTGCGMSEEMQTRLFRPFEQESNETFQQYGGSGLGLSIVKSLVTMMDGAISVESRPHEGSSFIVDLPFERSRFGKQASLSCDLKSIRVLAVDDVESERQYMATVLDRIGVRNTCVAGCDEALSEMDRAGAEGDAYSVCLVDWRMPHVDGAETTRRIRARYGSDVVVIVVSAYAHHQINETAQQAGADLFIAKPLFQSALFDLLVTLTGEQTVKKTGLGETNDLAGHRVLLVEDIEMNRIVAKGLIDRMGITCDYAENGQQAVDRFTASEPGYYDAILMDIKMPVMNGYEAARAIRRSAHPNAKTVPIIALTADAFNEDIAHALSAGMNAHVSKPIETRALARALETAFSEANQE